MQDAQGRFLAWLSKQVSPSKLSNYGMVLVELETFAKAKKIVSGSLFDTIDPVATGKIVYALTRDRFYRFMHKKDMRWIMELAQYLHRYTRETAATGSYTSGPAMPVPFRSWQASVDAPAADTLGTAPLPSTQAMAKKPEQGTFSAQAAAPASSAGGNSAPAVEEPDSKEITVPALPYQLETASAQYCGNTPAEAFARFCEHVAHEHPLGFRSLLDAKYNGDGPIVLFRTPPSGTAVLMHDPTAYISLDIDEQALVLYGKWICSLCGEVDVPLRIVSLSCAPEPLEADKGRPADADQPAQPDLPTEGPAAKQPDETAGAPALCPENEGNSNAARAEEIVLPADLAGMTIEALSQKLHISVAAAKKAVTASPRLVQLGEKIMHQDAFVDWEDGAEQLEKILDKLLERNDGYVSDTQLYDFAHADMQMFLNDNDMDDARLIYDMARHLFEKVGYHGKHLVFRQNAHISRPDMAISNVMDLMRSYARLHGGIFRESDLAQYLRYVGINSGNLTTGNLHIIMKFYTDPIFMRYDSDQLILGECMNIDTGWFADVQTALQKLFNDMGDHVVMRDIQPWWSSLLPALPTGRPWTLLLLQSVLAHYSKQLGGAHTISAMSGQSIDTIHAMLVSGNSEIQTFADAVIAFLVDDDVAQREFEAEDLRLRLVQRGMVAGGELIGNMPKALANDAHFVWTADGQRVLVKI